MSNNEYKGILVFAEQFGGNISPVTYELLGKASTLAAVRGCEVNAALLGHNVEHCAESLIAYGARRVYIYHHPELEYYRSDLYPALLAELARQLKPEVILFGATYAGRDLAPAVAALLGTGCSADCCDLSFNQNGNLEQIVPAFGGKIMAAILTPSHRPQIATVRPGVFPLPEPDIADRGEIIRPEFTLPREKIRLLEITREDAAPSTLAGAHTVVAGGAGVKDRKGWEMLAELAKCLGAALGGTRPAMDQGFIPESRMIGQSGHTIRPDLYIGVGISGDIQHMVGITEAKTIVAVNKDPKAPVFKQADYGIVGDYREIVPELIKLLKNK